ncbi:glutamyl-tRNA reductase [Silvibacterium dinghuense]|uniref:Glutamyl-tRNA reductase n=1 Tax=Silvibacterium dinghuense TaxID=1560006 RepID=A0A4Q1SDL0_9BACT|nr:glutamyl-tRNA reductase [Silvibacterium dinghuense]RXS95314.1 glutamyl-tRNA reductase [Silvibacterium dinghuense]GGH12338.1 glutamyl-tRNA reductase [Silvibacterium dinghuense]
MKLLLTGLNHKTAPVELREQLAVAPDRLGSETAALLEHEGVREAMIVSTCNRVEMLVAYDGPEPELAEFLHARYAVEPAQLMPHLYEYRETEAARHLFRVAASLDSMVVGEPQILGQVKEAYAVAREVGAVGGNLERLLQGAFAAAKKVRTETQIGSSSVSIASVGVDLVRKIFGSLKGKRVLLVGAGKMSELAARHLLQQGAGSLIISNRTQERAVRLAQKFEAHVIRFDDIYARAHEADILITSTGAPDFLFRPHHAQQFLQKRKNRPMVLIDIAVPRDIDPEINRIDGAFLYDIDDLQQVAASNLVDRGREAQRAESLLEQEVERYRVRVETLDVVPTLRELQGYAEQVRQGELRRAQSRLQALTPDQMAAVEAVTRGLVNKFLHHPLQALKSAARDGDAAAIDAIRAAFHLGPTIDPADSAPSLREQLARLEDHD